MLPPQLLFGREVDGCSPTPTVCVEEGEEGEEEEEEGA